MQEKSLNQQESLIGIKGYEGTTLIDFPGRISTLIFIGGCNFRCPFCHNPELVLPNLLRETPNLSLEEIKDIIRKRSKIIRGVSFTGGEPLIWNGLPELLRWINDELGLLTKIDTNGYLPDRLRKVIDEGLVDYVAMDIKAAPEDYPEATGVPNLDFGKILESVDIIKSSGIEYEFRTTAVPTFVTEESIRKIGEVSRGARLHAIQQFRNLKTLSGDYADIKPYPRAVLDRLVEILSQFVQKVELRGV